MHFSSSKVKMEDIKGKWGDKSAKREKATGDCCPSTSNWLSNSRRRQCCQRYQSQVTATWIRGYMKIWKIRFERGSKKTKKKMRSAKIKAEKCQWCTRYQWWMEHLWLRPPNWEGKVKCWSEAMNHTFCSISESLCCKVQMDKFVSGWKSANRFRPGETTQEQGKSGIVLSRTTTEISDTA